MGRKNDAIVWFEFTDSENILKHFHREVELFYILEGQAEITVDGETSYLNKGDFLLVNTNRMHSLKGEKQFLAGYIHIDYGKLCDYLGREHVFFLCDSSKEHSERYRRIRQLILKIFRQYFEQEGNQRITRDITYLNLLYELSVHFQIFQEHPRYQKLHGTEDDSRKNYIEEYIENHYTEKLTLSDMANELYLTDTYFAKYMKRTFDMTFVEYVNKVRLSHTVEDILYSPHSLTRIAMDNGFSNMAVFKRIFKEAFGMFPSEYRKQIGQNKNEAEMSAAGEELRCEEKTRKAIFLEEFETGEEHENRRQIYVDAAGMKELLLSKWIVNIGTIESLLNSGVRRQIELLQSEFKFEYARFWGLYFKELYLLTDKNDKELNFNKIDRAFDYLMELKIHPFLELGMKPLQIIKTLDNYILYQEPDITFENPEAYGGFICDFLIHCVNRYGEKEVASWYFEVYCGLEEPNILKYWDYFKAAYQAVKDCIPEAKIGGAGFNMSREQKNFQKFVKKWGTDGVVPDFVSLNSYHYLPYAQEGEPGVWDKKWKRSLDNKYLYNQIQAAKEIVMQEKKQAVEMCVVEWNLTNSSREVLNDSCFKGAYILKEMIDTIGCVDKIGYWTMLDSFSELADSTRVLDGSNGILTRDGIQKPCYYAFSFMGRLGNRLAKKEKNCLVTSDDYGNYYIVCHNYKSTVFHYYLNMGKEMEEQSPEDMFEDYETLGMEIIIEQVKNGTYRSHTELMNAEDGSVFDEWKRMGEPDDLKKPELEYLKRVSVPRVYVEKYSVENQRLNLYFNLKPNEIRYIQIQYMK